MSPQSFWVRLNTNFDPLLTARQLDRLIEVSGAKSDRNYQSAWSAIFSFFFFFLAPFISLEGFHLLKQKYVTAIEGLHP